MREGAGQVKTYEIDGKKFLGAKDAARHLRCSVWAFYKAYKSGKIDRLGKRSKIPFRVKSAGRLYNSAKECAKKNGVSVATVYRALYDCREDSIGVQKNPNYKEETKDYFQSKA